MIRKGTTLNGDRGYQIFTMDFNRYLYISPDTEIGATFQE